MKISRSIVPACLLLAFAVPAAAQIGRQFPSEKKVVKDPVTGTMLTFLTSTPTGDSKIYQTHNQWTSDGQWLIFRSGRVRGEAMAVNEKTGEMIQVTEGGYSGMLSIARYSMKLYFMRDPNRRPPPTPQPTPAPGATPSPRQFQPPASLQIVEVDLAKLFADSKAGKMQRADYYQKVLGTTPVEIQAGGDMALDADEKWVYFRVGREEAARHLSPDTKIEKSFGPRNMGAGPSGIAAMELATGKFKHVVSVPFQVGHIQTNGWMPGEIVFCWETGGKSPQRMWTVKSDGTGLRPVYPEPETDWVTHEAVITKDEVAFAIMGPQDTGRHKRRWRGDRCAGRQSGTGAGMGTFGDSGEADRTGDREPSHARDAHRWPNRKRQRPVACQRFAGRAFCGR